LKGSPPEYSLPEYNNEDIRRYVLERLRIGRYDFRKDDTASSEVQIESLASKVSEAAKGIFLYADLLFNTILPKLPNVSEYIDKNLPESLGGIYSEFLNREVERVSSLWDDKCKPLLGLIAVSYGQGLTKQQIESIMSNDLGGKVDVDGEIRASEQYLEVQRGGSYRVFHKSFSDFLIGHEDNVHYKIDGLEMQRKIVYHYWRVVRPKEPERITNVDRWERIARKEKNESYYYPLRHLADHLDYLVKPALDAEEQEIDMLYDLARNSDFANAQLEHVGDVELPLKTIRFAITAASQLDDAPSIAEFIASHARRISEFREGSPLRVLREGQTLENALRMADIYDNDFSVIWYLLLALELKQQGPSPTYDSINTLQRIADRDSTIVQGHLEDILLTTLLLAFRIMEMDSKPILERLCNKVLAEYQYSEFCDLLYRQGNFRSADNLVASMRIAENKTDAFRRIAKAQAQAGMIDDAKKTLEEALNVAESIVKYSYYALNDLKEIVKMQIQAGDTIRAISTVKTIALRAPEHILDIASLLIQTRDLESLRQLILTCAYSEASACYALALLFYAYPGQKQKLSQTVTKIIVD